MSDLIMTVDSDDEDVQLVQPTAVASSSKKAAKKAAPPPPEAEKDDLNPEFIFDAAGFANGGETDWGKDLVEDIEEGKEGGFSVDDIIARRRSVLVKNKVLNKNKDASKRKRAADESASDNDSDDQDSDAESEGSWKGVDGDAEEDDESSEEEDGFGMGVTVEDDAEGGADPLSSEDEAVDPLSGDDEDEAASDDDDNVSIASSNSSVHETQAQIDRKAAFFSSESALLPPPSASEPPASFASMNLSRPILRNITALNFTNPTPIQARTIPLALLGRDILGSAVTGSGKTAAFMIPVLERMLYREKGKGGKGSASRVLVLCPTRELAVQCEAVGKALAAGMDVRFALLVGGLSLSAQSTLLRTLPDILIATPGRLIDHIRNSPSFTMDALDILIVDEADRMLEAGFSDELNEIIASCPRSRQTMLFSATMTDSVDELVRLSLNKPVRLFVDSTRKTAKNLVQEFVRVREKGQDGQEDVNGGGTRAAILLALCKRTVKDKCIVFFRSKALAHQMRVMFGLCGLKAGELHGNLTQEQRLQALQDFKDGKVQYLLATDLASRGLDIKGVETVINYDMPGQLAAYVHRVGRTARAGRKGRSITLVGEADRKMLKAAVKSSPQDNVRHRVVPPEAVAKMAEDLANLKQEVQEVLREEKEEKALRTADMEIRKGENMIEHRDEIMSRPARTWFQTEKEKKASADASKVSYVSGFDAAAAALKGKGKGKDELEVKKPKRDKYDGLSRRLKRRKMAAEEDAEVGDGQQISASIRSAKKSSRPTKITEAEAVPAGKQKGKGKGKGKTASGDKPKKITIGKGAFDTEFGKKGEAARGEGARAGRKDGVGMGKSGKSKTAPKGGAKGGKPKGKGGKR